MSEGLKGEELLWTCSDLRGVFGSNFDDLVGASDNFVEFEKLIYKY
jgi:hypothetical protein